MSNVLQRKRSVSDREFYKCAIDIRIELTRIACSESAVPKRYRVILGAPMVDTAKSLVDNIVRSESFYPNTARGVIYRRHYLTLAIADCHRIVQDLQVLKDIGLPVNLNRLTNVADMLDREMALLKGTRKSVKLTGDASIGERIAKARAELEDLEQARDTML